MGLVYDLNKAIKVPSSTAPKEKAVEKKQQQNAAASPTKNTPTKTTQVVKGKNYKWYRFRLPTT